MPRWVVTVSLMLVPTAVNGFGRFGYGLVLPAMQDRLGWSGPVAGTIAAANTAGYLVGAVLADRVLARSGERAAVLGGLAGCTVSVLACAGTTSVLALGVLRFAAGITGAIAFVAGAAMLLRRTADAETSAGRYLGAYFAGPGVGVAVSALVVTPVAVAGHWRAGWALLGAASLVCVAVVAAVVTRMPTTRPVPSPTRSRHWRLGPIRTLLLSYALFGVGYVVFMTFAVAYLGAHGRTAGELTWFWFTLGAAGVVLGLFAGPLSRIPGGGGVAVAVIVTAVASALPVLSAGPVVALVSAAGFGAFFSVTAVATTCARRRLPPDRWPAAVAGLTTAFGVGQCVGPVAGGFVADLLGTGSALLFGTVVLFASAAIALAQPGTAARRGRTESGAAYRGRARSR